MKAYNKNGVEVVFFESSDLGVATGYYYSINNNDEVELVGPFQTINEAFEAYDLEVA